MVGLQHVREWTEGPSVFGRETPPSALPPVGVQPAVRSCNGEFPTGPSISGCGAVVDVKMISLWLYRCICVGISYFQYIDALGIWFVLDLV